MFFSELFVVGHMVLICLSWKDGQRAGMRKTFDADGNQLARDQNPSSQLSAATHAVILAEGHRTCAGASSQRFADSTKALNPVLIVDRRTCRFFQLPRASV